MIWTVYFELFGTYGLKTAPIYIPTHKTVEIITRQVFKSPIEFLRGQDQTLLHQVPMLRA